jgi:hypothetical protein
MYLYYKAVTAYLPPEYRIADTAAAVLAIAVRAWPRPLLSPPQSGGWRGAVLATAIRGQARPLFSPSQSGHSRGRCSRHRGQGAGVALFLPPRSGGGRGQLSRRGGAKCVGEYRVADTAAAVLAIVVRGAGAAS